MIRERFEELKHTGNLPSPSGVGMRILLLTQDEECDLDAIVHTIQADPALTGRIIKLASSVQMGGPGGGVTSARDAAVRLGLRTVTNVALGFSLVNANRTGRCERFDYERYWSRSLACAVAAQVLSEELRIGAPAEAFTCALLSRIGSLALASVHPTVYARVLEQAEGEAGADLRQLEKSEFGVESRQITVAMLEDWGLPPAFTEALAVLDAPAAQIEDAYAGGMLRLLRAAGPIAEVCMTHTDGQPRFVASLRQVFRELEVAPDAVCRTFDRIASSWIEWGEVLEVRTNAVLGFDEMEKRAAASEVQPSAEAPPRSKRLRILAVDDDPVSLKLLVRHLRNAGHLVVTATNGKEALALALQTNPQIVVTDWMMPEMDGLALCKALRRVRTGRNLYILVLTGRAEEDSVVAAFDAGVDDYIVKPFKPKLLMARIRGGERVVRLQEQVEQDMRIKDEQNANLMAAKRKLKAAAMTDSLTEMPNRRYAMKRLEIEWDSSTRTGLPLAAIMLDIDKFKSINDNYGHAVGDIVLQSTARTIARTLRKGDTCARIGGEEFLVICPATDAEGAFQVAERIRVAIESSTIQAGDFDGAVTASLGVAARMEATETVDGLLRMADGAVYEAKAQGRNQVVAGRPEGDRRRAG